jgi:aryl-alcohol dehydrogenase-like predicted oxidoreductase
LTAARTRREGLSLIAAAANAGMTLFDTADIYGQGESERILGDALKSIDACIVTKAGQRFSLAKSVLLPLRGAAERFSQARAAAVAARAKPLPRNYTPEYFRRALLGSLRRSQREQADIFLLHSPSAADLKDGEALDRLGAFKQEGLARCVGVSCDDQATLASIASDERVEAISSSDVVNADGRVHHVDTLYVVGCVTFHTSGHANPMLTIVAMALRLAQHLEIRFDDRFI